MAERKMLTEKDYETIITLRFVFGRAGTDIAKEIGCSETSVFNVLAVFSAVREQKWERCIEMLYKRYPYEMFVWAAKRLGCELPDDVKKAYDNLRNPGKAVAAKAAEETEAPKACVKDNSIIFLTRLIEELAKLNENMEALMDTVIPKYAEDQRSATIRVASVVCNKLQPLIDNVDTIKRELCK